MRNIKAPVVAYIYHHPAGEHGNEEHVVRFLRLHEGTPMGSLDATVNGWCLDNLEFRVWYREGEKPVWDETECCADLHYQIDHERLFFWNVEAMADTLKRVRKSLEKSITKLGYPTSWGERLLQLGMLFGVTEYRLVTREDYGYANIEYSVLTPSSVRSIKC
jgi:hypothetical protein